MAKVGIKDIKLSEEQIKEIKEFVGTPDTDNIELLKLRYISRQVILSSDNPHLLHKFTDGPIKR